MKVSVVIASRLQALPGGATGELYLHRAVDSVRRQTVYGRIDLEIVVGLDPGERLLAPLPGVRAVNAGEARQASAVNAAVGASRGEVVAFLEDDDVWHRRRLEYGVKCLAECDLVTSNQLEAEPGGLPVRVNDYPTPSGWLLPRAVWDRVGGFDPSFTFVDSDFLGRAGRLGVRRVHLVEHKAGARESLGQVGRVSTIWRTAEDLPLVLRSINPAGVTGAAQQQEAARLRHQEDCRRMVEKYGTVPW